MLASVEEEEKGDETKRERNENEGERGGREGERERENTSNKSPTLKIRAIVYT